MNFIYGPVYSWRLGRSLGIDLLSQEDKVCSFDCRYCQVGGINTYTVDRKVYVPTESVVKELNMIPDVQVDWITFSGRGEPTLAKNLGEAILAVKDIRKDPVAVLTNASLIYRPDVKGELMYADFVACKLDAASRHVFSAVNRQANGIVFEDICEGIRRFKKDYKGRFAIQIMFVRANLQEAEDIAEIVRSISPDEVQINTPGRPPKDNALEPAEMLRIKGYFKGLNIISVFDKPIEDVSPINADDILKRRDSGMSSGGQ